MAVNSVSTPTSPAGHHYAVRADGYTMALNDSQEHAYQLATMFANGAVVELVGALPECVAQAVRALNKSIESQVAAARARRLFRVVREAR